MNIVDSGDPPDSYYSAPFLGASACATQHLAPYLEFTNICWLHLRAEKRQLENLAVLGENWDGNGSAAPLRSAINKVSEEMPALYQAVSTEPHRWAEPHITASESGEIVLEWWHGRRKVTLYISDSSVEYIKVGSIDIDEMESGPLSSPRDFIAVWAWLHA